MPSQSFAVSTDPDQWDEAVKWFLARSPMTRADWDKLSESARRKAFMISHTGNMDVINQVWKTLDKAQKNGTSLDAFRKSLLPSLKSAWGGTNVNDMGAVANPAWRIETIYRTNLQGAYGAGRWAQQTSPPVLKVRPFWALDVILDNRTSQVCDPIAGTVLPASDPFWKTHVPPLHFNCRSAIRSLRESQAQKWPKFGQDAPSFNPAQGFGLAPGEGEWKPDLSKYPPELRTHLEARLAELDKGRTVELPEGAKIVEGKKAEAPKTPMVEVKDAIGWDYEVKGTSRQKAQLEKVAEEIGKVHRFPDTGRRKPEVVLRDPPGSASTAGRYSLRSSDGEPMTFLIRPKSVAKDKSGASVFSHEFGHYLDHMTGKGGAAFGSDGTSPALEALRKAWNGSPVVKAMIAEWDLAVANATPEEMAQVLERKSYWLSNVELFARTYAQWIARKTGNEQLKVGILSALQLGSQWTRYDKATDTVVEDGFDEISDAFEAYMKELGLLE